MSFYNPLAFLFLLAVPAIIILYLLKQRHQDYTVSSLYLWQEVLKDLEANAPWQKLRKNLLMFLQIAAVVLLTLALARPYIKQLGSNSVSCVILIDTSMSMQATDIKPSRFEAAKKQAVNYVSNIKPGTLVTLISMGSNAFIEENLSADKNSLLEKIKNLKVSNTPANTEDAASLIYSIVKQYPESKIVLLGDEPLLISGVNIDFYNMSQGGSNYAITLLSHSVTKNSITALSRVANFTSSLATVPVSLYVDGKVFDAKNIDIKAGETASIFWNNVPLQTKFLECRIDIQDHLDADNFAWDAVNPAKSQRVLLASEKNIFLEKVLSLMNNVELFKTTFETGSEYKGYDLYIFDGKIPDKLPTDGNIMIFNPQPYHSQISAVAEAKLLVLEKSNHDIFKHINDYSFSVGKSKVLKVPTWGDLVLNSKDGPLAFCGTLENRRILVFGFDIHNTDIPLRPVFPILMTNAFEWLMPSSIKNVAQVFPGQGLSFNLDPKAQQVSVRSPSGKIDSLAPPFPAKIYDKTEEIGLYTLEQKVTENTLRHFFTVNVPAERESNLQAKPIEISPADNKAGVEPVNKNISTGFNLQHFFIWAVLILLLIEWWVYTHGI